MNCDWEPVEKDGRLHHRCKVCGYEKIPVALAANPKRRCDQAAKEPRKDRTNRPCSHIGPEVRQQICNTCSGKQRIKIFACSIHGECTLGKQLDGITCCKGCGDYAPSPP